MGTRTVLLGLLVGCGFEATPNDEEMSDPPPGGMTDPTDVVRKCALSDGSLRLCIDFEDTETFAGDGSSYAHAVTSYELTAMTRDQESAVQMSAQSKLHVAESTNLDLASKLTISMWMNPTQRPAGGTSYTMLDNDGQYGVSYRNDGRVRCSFGGEYAIESVAAVPAMPWNHVACTYDGERTRMWINGNIAACSQRSGALPKNGTNGTAIGADVSTGPLFTNQFVGGLDNIQVFARAWSGSELCAAAGLTECKTNCGNGNGSDD